MRKINIRTISIFLLMLLLLVFLFVRYTGISLTGKFNTGKDIVTKPQVLSVTEYVETSPGKYSVYKDDVENNTSALQYLQKTSKVRISGKDENAFVVAINGRIADNNKREFWAFYVNDKPSPVGAGSYILKDGDIIQWKIEVY